MGNFKLDLGGQTFELLTVPGSARIQVHGPGDLVCFFDPELNRYLDSKGSRDLINPQDMRHLWSRSR